MPMIDGVSSFKVLALSFASAVPAREPASSHSGDTGDYFVD